MSDRVSGSADILHLSVLTGLPDGASGHAIDAVCDGQMTGAPLRADQVYVRHAAQRQLAGGWQAT